MESEALNRFKCSIHDLPLDDSWQCPDRDCRAAHCPHCGRHELDRCEHLFFTEGEWVYYAPDGISSEDFPGVALEEFELDALVEAFEGDEDMAGRLAGGGDPLPVLLEMAVERLGCATLTSYAGGWTPGSDSWSNTWVQDPQEALSTLHPLLDRYLRGIAILRDRDSSEDNPQFLRDPRSSP